MIEFLPKQLECLKALAVDSPFEIVLFGGGAGGSKSFIGCAWQIQRRLKYKGTRGLIGRSKLDTLKKTTLKTFFEVAGMFGLIANKHYQYNASSNVITFNNGSEIVLKDLFSYPSDPSFDSLGSLEITDYYIDECSQVSKKAVDIVRSRVRFKLTEYNLPPKGLLTCNPSKGWLYNEFYSLWASDELPPYMSFIQARAIDNPYLPSSYIDTLSKLPEQDRKRLLDGDWNYDDSNDALYSTDDILKCFRDADATGELFITADIARLGKDRSVIGLWRGLSLIQVIELRRKRVNEVADAIKSLANLKYVKLGNIIIDEDGVGGGVCDLIKGTRGFRNGSRSTQPDRFTNLKAECYFKLAEFIEFGRMVFPQEYRDLIVKELDMIRRKNPDGDTKLSVTGKEEIQRMHGVSPDYADMIMMRMYFELYPNYGKYSYV
jgi:phage terminase large subunit